MQRHTMALLFFLTALVPSCSGMFADWQSVDSGERQVVWRSVDPMGSFSLNENTNISANYISLKSYGGVLYSGWHENGMYHIRIFNGNDDFPMWQTLPNLGLAGDTNGVMEIHDGRIYVLYFAAGDLRCQRLKSDQSGWEDITPGGGIDYGATPQEQLTLVSYAGKLYALWKEAPPGFIRMKRYDGGDVWTGGAGVEDVNGIQDTVATSYGLHATIHNGLLFASYGMVSAPAPHTVLRVRAYNGAGWVTVGGNIAINNTSSDFAQLCTITSYNNSLYMLWREYNNFIPHDGLWAIRYNGLAWQRMDGKTPLTRDGLRYFGSNDTSVNNTMSDARMNALAVVNGRLVAAWREYTGTGPNQLRCALFSGDEGSPYWFFIDGGMTNGLNFNPLQSVDEVYAVSHDSKIYIGFTEWDISLNFHVKVGY